MAAAASGSSAAAVALLEMVYDELRALAAQKLAHEKRGNSLSPTALVHEAWIRLAGPARQGRFQDQPHFVAAAVQAMRRILIEQARRKNRLRRGGREWKRIDIDLQQVIPSADDDRLLAMDEWVEELERRWPDVAEVLKLRLYLGLSVEETAASLSCSPRTVKRRWRFARAWLITQYDELNPHAAPGTTPEERHAPPEP